jgi:hypothetical protein
MLATHYAPRTRLRLNALRVAAGEALLAMCAELGFHIAVDPDDPSVKTVTLPVHPAHLTLR